jgi:hypothetical protein
MKFQVERGFEILPDGKFFRFWHRNEPSIGLKASSNRGESGALVLQPTKHGLRPGDLLNPVELDNVVPLDNVRIDPSRSPGSITPGEGHFALPGEVEIRGGGLLFITHEQGGLRWRVDVQAGNIDLSHRPRPVEIYSEWSLVQTDGKVLYQHKPAIEDHVIVQI